MHSYLSRKSVIIITAVSILVWSISTYLHDPATPVIFGLWGLKYSDIVHGVFYTRFTLGSEKYWFSEERFIAYTRGALSCPLPYLDYHFEYPPVVGLLWLTSTCIAFMASKDLDVAVRIHYYVQAIFNLVFILVCAIALERIVSRTYCEHSRKVLAILTPTLIMYLVYNWDIVSTALAILGILAVTKEKYFKAGLLLGISFSTKMLTIGIAYYFFTKLLFVSRKLQRAFEYCLGLFLTGLLPFILLYLIAPRGLIKMMEHHATWYCENCLYMLFIKDIWSPLHKYLYFAFSGLHILLLTALLLTKKNHYLKLEFAYLYAFTSILTVLNYVFSPQMLIMLLPLAVLALNGILLLEYLVADFFNATLIVEFFNELQRGGNPWIWGSVTQSIAMIRNIILVLLLWQVTFTLFKQVKST